MISSSSQPYPFPIWL